MSNRTRELRKRLISKRLKGRWTPITKSKRLNCWTTKTDWPRESHKVRWRSRSTMDLLMYKGVSSKDGWDKMPLPGKLATVNIINLKIRRPTISSVSHSSEWIFWRWLIYLIDLVVDNLFYCFTFPPTQHTVSFETKSPIVSYPIRRCDHLLYFPIYLFFQTADFRSQPRCLTSSQSWRSYAFKKKDSLWRRTNARNAGLRIFYGG